MAANQINKALVRPVIFAASIIATIEATTWTILALLSIFYYNGVIVIGDLSATSYANIIYQAFLNTENTSNELIVNPSNFNMFMYVYVIASFVWLGFSLYLLWATTRDKWNDLPTFVACWSTATLMVSAVDIILMGLIAADYSKISDLLAVTTASTESSAVTTVTITVATTASSTEATTTTVSTTASTTVSTTPSTTEVTTPSTTPSPTDPGSRFFQIYADSTYPDVDKFTTAYGIVMSAAARGYILWVVNVVFAIVLAKFAYDMFKSETPSLLPIIDAYSTGSRPWSTNLYEQTDIGNGHANGAFKDDERDAAFTRSRSFENVAADSGRKNVNPLSLPASPKSSPPSTYDKVAGIGKRSGRRSPPQRVDSPKVPPPSHFAFPGGNFGGRPSPNVPFIPEPDYTPPGSPRSQPKSVLRPKSKYVL